MDIQQLAEKLGFAACGISRAEALPLDAERVEQWLAQGFEGSMSYLQRNKDKRYDPRLLVEGTKSIVTVLYNYYPSQQLDCTYKIAKYAYGKDYHVVLKDRLRDLLAAIEETTGPLQPVRIFTDSAPVLDRVWAVRCGLGFIGKNTMLIHPKKGSFFFIGHLFLPIELEPTGQPMPNHCGNCTRCLDACPTGALIAPFTLDARRCISYLTIEDARPVTSNVRHTDFDTRPATPDNWIYGCDCCQDACPYNKFSLPNLDPDFQASKELLSMKKEDWTQLDETTFDRIFKDSAVQRVGYQGLKDNIYKVK